MKDANYYIAKVQQSEGVEKHKVMGYACLNLEKKELTKWLDYLISIKSDLDRGELKTCTLYFNNSAAGVFGLNKTVDGEVHLAKIEELREEYKSRL